MTDLITEARELATENIGQPTVFYKDKSQRIMLRLCDALEKANAEIDRLSQLAMMRESEIGDRDREIERLREAQRWIPAEDELPKYTANYNVVCNVGSMLGGYTDVRTYRFERIQGAEPRWCIPDRYDEVVTIIHWMPLPEPPKEGAEHERDL